MKSTLLILVATAAAVRAEQPPGIDYLGVGYDLVFGNPNGAEDASSVMDPGFRIHTVLFTWDDTSNLCSGLANNWTCPREAMVLPATSCFQQSSARLISSQSMFQQELQRDCSVSATSSGSFGGFSASAAFSASDAMSDMFQTTVVDKTDVYQSKAVCVDYVAMLKPMLSDATFGLLPEFVASVKALPPAYVSCYLPDSTNLCPPIVGMTGSCTCADSSVNKYFSFIQTFGTHYTTRIEMGGKIIHRVEIKHSDTTKLKANSVDVAYGASIKASYDSFFFSASASASINSAASAAVKSYKDVMNVAQKEININIGGSPNEDWRAWAKTTMDTPMPIRYKLVPLSELVGRVDVSKGPLFERAVADYAAAYGRKLSAATAVDTVVKAIEIRSTYPNPYSNEWVRIFIGKTGDMPADACSSPFNTNTYRCQVPPQYQLPFNLFAGKVPVTFELSRCGGCSGRIVEKMQPIAVMSDDTSIPLDNQNFGKFLPVSSPQSVNPIS